MIAGRMRHKLVLLEPQRVVDRMGAEDTVYTETRTVHAERVKFSGRRSEEVGEHFPEYRAEFNAAGGPELEQAVNDAIAYARETYGT